MKNNSYLLFLTILFYSFQVNAQFSFGMQLGYNKTNVATSVSNEFYEPINYPVKTKNGLNIGLAINYSFNKRVSIESGLFYTQKGYQIDWDTYREKVNTATTFEGHWRYYYDYLELPIHFTYQIYDIHLFIGPYLAYGIRGKSIIDLKYINNPHNYGTINDETDLNAVIGGIDSNDLFECGENSIRFNKSYNAFDYGIEFGLGYQYKRLLFKGQYNLGLHNLTPYIKGSDNFDPNEYRFTHKGFSLSVILYFIK